jgi:hypothetical protein
MSRRQHHVLERRKQLAKRRGNRDRSGRHLRARACARVSVGCCRPRPYHLVGRRIDLRAVPAEDKYLRKTHFMFDAPSPNFMLELYLLRPEHAYRPQSAPHIITVLGDVFFDFTS